MKLRGLIELTFLLILASCAEGNTNWEISVQSLITAERGSNVTINCTFNCPLAYCKDPDAVQVNWKNDVKRGKKGDVKDKDAYIYHENNTRVLEEYRGRTEVLKSKGNRSCSLKIQNVTADVEDLYVRLFAGTQRYSFYSKAVSIRVVDKNYTSSENETKPNPEKNNSTQMYTAICVSIAALVIIMFILGVFCFIKRKRTQSITREESGYYANFSRASSNDAKSEISSKKIDTLPELKDIEEPVYVNMKYPLDQSMDQTNNVYGNVDYSR